MSWRETLGLAKAACVLHAHNPHNAQKPRGQGNSADSADSASVDFEETSSRLLEVLSDACYSLPITPAVVREALAPEDIEDWRNGKIASDQLAAFARSLVQRREIDQGKRPDHYTEQATCQHCGPIWLWFSGEVLGCPWCWNRVANRPIPRPHAVRCQDCTHFRRTDHSHLGRCTNGNPDARAGLWDADRRYCERYLAHPSFAKRADIQMISEKSGGKFGRHG